MSASQAIAASGCRTVDRALLTLHAVMPSQRGAKARCEAVALLRPLRRALMTMMGCSPGDPEHMAALDAARAAAQQAEEAIGRLLPESEDAAAAAAELASLAAQLGASREEVQRAAPAGSHGSPVAAFVASGVAAAIHAIPPSETWWAAAIDRLERDTLPASIAEPEAAEALPTPDVWIRWRRPPIAETRRTIAVPPPAPMPGARRHVERSARACLDEIAAAFVLRTPRGDRPWSDAARVEKRMLAALDAFGALAEPASACGADLLALVVHHSYDALTVEPARAFARAFVLGSMAGPEPIASALDLRDEIHPSLRAAETMGLALGSSPDAVPTLRALLGDGDASLVRLSLEVLDRRRALGAAEIIPLTLHPDPGVARAAARALGQIERAPATVAALTALLGLEHDDEVALAAAESLAVLGSPDGAAAARARLSDEREAPGMLSDRMRRAFGRLLAVAGDQHDAELLADSVRGDSAAVGMLGWHGAAAHVDGLIELLDLANQARRGSGAPTWAMELALAEALARITGAPLLAAERAEPSVDLDALDRDVLDRVREVPGLEDKSRKMMELVAAAGHIEREADAWARWWHDERGRFGPRLRYRRGEPWHPSASLDEIAAPHSLPGDRALAALELSIALGPPSLDHGDWVARQRLELERLRHAAQHTRRGEWPSRRAAA